MSCSKPVIKNPVSASLNANSQVQIPTVINATFSAILVVLFAMIHRDRSRVIRGTPLPMRISKP
jgi:hypothetical protein